MFRSRTGWELRRLPVFLRTLVHRVFELADKGQQFGRQPFEFLCGGIEFVRSGRSAQGRLGDAGDILRDFGRNLGAFGNVHGNRARRCGLFVDGAGDGAGEIVYLIDDRADGGDRQHGALGIRLDGLDSCAYLQKIQNWMTRQTNLWRRLLNCGFR